MKNLCILIVFLTALLGRMADAQTLTPDQLQISAGYSIPQAPVQFYDYWSNGIGANVIAVYDRASTFSSAVTLGFDRFALDEKRYFKRVGITENLPSVDGGATTLVSIGGQMRYRIPGYDQALPYCFAGIGLQYSHRSETSIAYPFASATTPSSDGVGVFVPIGASVEFSYRGKFDAVISVQHSIGIAGKNGAEAGFTALRIGIVLPVVSAEQ